MKKRIISLLEVLVIVLNLIPLFIISTNATSNIVINGVDIGYADGSYFTKNGKSCYNTYWSNGRCHHNGVCDDTTHPQCNCMRYWPTGDKNTCQVDLKASQCFGYARYCEYIVYGEIDANSNSHFTDITGAISKGNCTASVLKSKLLNCSPATHIRLNDGHSISIVSSSDYGVNLTDCNKNGYCQIRYLTKSWDEFASFVQSWGGISYSKSWNRGGGIHYHSYTGSYYEAAHPHKEYQQCSCGATQYTGRTRTVSGCAQCSMTNDSKYGGVLQFKSYPCVGSTFEVKKSDLTTRNGEIWTSDECTIKEIYTNGWCLVNYPVSGGTKDAYTQISNFIKDPSARLTPVTAPTDIPLYSTSSLSTKTYTVYAGDSCYSIGTSGNATQLFMPVTGKNIYVLGWVNSNDLVQKEYDERFNPYCPIKAFPCVNNNFEVQQSDYSTHAGWIYTTDFCTINAVYADGWCNVTFPVTNSSGGITGYLTGYTPLSNFVYNVNFKHVAYQTSSQIDVYTRKELDEYLTWWVGAGDTFYVVSEYGSAKEVFYPIDSAYGGGYKLAWMPDSSLPRTTYTVSYNANGGTGAPGNQTKVQNVDLTLSSTIPTRSGYTFAGWATSSSASYASYAANSIYSGNADLTLYAVWRPNTYTITYNANGGVNAPGDQTQTHGTAITVTNEKPSKTFTVTFNANGGTVSPTTYSLDCTFSSWNENSAGTGTTVNSNSSYKPDRNVTLYAVFSTPTLGSYPIPQLAGYSFDGWYTSASGGTRVDGSTTITSNKTFYAHWAKETFTVSYYDDGASNLPDDQVKTYGEALTLSTAIPTKDGYTFKGWTTTEGSSAVVYNPGDQYTSDEWVILYAVWEETPIQTDTKAIVENKTARAGDDIIVNVTLDKAPAIKSLAASNITYNTDALELTEVQWTVVGATLSSWDVNTGKGAAAYQGATDLNGGILTLKFHVKDAAEDGEYAISLKVTAKDADNKSIAVATEPGKITVRSVLAGDLNGDNEVTDEDAIHLLFYTFFPDEYPINQNCDFNGDGQITDEDAIYLLFYTFFPDEYPLG